MADERECESPSLRRILHRLDDIERLIIQTYRGELRAMNQIDTDVKTLATNFAQATADQQTLLQALTNAVTNSTADDPSTDPLVVSITTAMQANHQAVLDGLGKLGITIPPPSDSASQVAAPAGSAAPATGV